MPESFARAALVHEGRLGLRPFERISLAVQNIVVDERFIVEIDQQDDFLLLCECKLNVNLIHSGIEMPFPELCSLVKVAMKKTVGSSFLFHVCKILLKC